MNKLFALLFATLFSLPLAAEVGGGFGDEEPLMPEEAFRLKAYAVDAETVRAQWDIEEGYYLYRGKFKFSTDTTGVTLGEGKYPPGKVKEDEFFGKVETYRKQVAIDLPITVTGDTKQFKLTTVSQGCADAGLCYPPQTVTVDVDLIPAAMAADSAPAKSGTGLLASLSQKLGLGGDEEEFLPAEQVFVPSVEAADGNTLLVRFDIRDGYYLYRDKFSFAIAEGEGLSLGQGVFPKGKEKVDEAFGRMEVYYEEVEIRLPVDRTALGAMDMALEVNYQGCAERGFCYPPTSQIIPVSLPAGETQAAFAGEDDLISEQDTIAQTLRDSSVWWIIASFFGFGLLLAFTPCVFPMVPILSGIIVGQGEGITTRRAFIMSLVYVLAMALTYTVAGVIAGASGANLQAAFQNPWILSAFAGVFGLLALSMFGFYDLQLPASWQSKLTEISNKQQGGTLAGVAVMGFLSALIVGPCVAAPLAGALIYISQTGDAVLGGIALFALSLGMGAPLLAIGTSAGKLLPRAGGWMEAVKAVFGVLLLAVAIWMLERILPATVTLFLWAVLLIVSAIYMGALSSLAADAGGWRKLWKGFGTVMLFYGALLLIGAASGGSDPLQPLRGLSLAGGEGGGAAAHELEFKTIKSVEDLEAELAAAKGRNQPVMLDFYADWCASCKEMERYTFSDAGVQQALAGALLLQADVTANDAIDKALMKKFGIIGPPSILFFDRQGHEHKKARLVGFMEPVSFRQHAERVFAQ